jgi:hypothetical protein
VIPAIFKVDIFIQAFENAELVKISRTEMESFEYSLKVYHDLKAVINKSMDQDELKGKQEGIQEGILHVARQLKQQGIATDIFIRAT